MQAGQRHWFSQLIAVLPFSCSCLVSSSPSEVWQFKFECCPQAQEMSSSCPALELAFCCACLLGFAVWGLISLPRPLSLGHGQYSGSPPALCNDGLLFVFQFCGEVWLWGLLTGSEDELCDPLPALLWGVAYHLPALGLPAFSVFVFWEITLRLALDPPPFSGALSALPLPSAVVLDYGSLFCYSGFFGAGSVCPGSLLVYPWDWLGEFCMMHGTHLFGLSNVSQAGLEPAVAALKFSQCIVL
jgi:hypothetical protein